MTAAGDNTAERSIGVDPGRDGSNGADPSDGFERDRPESTARTARTTIAHEPRVAPSGVALGVLAVLAVFYTLYFASDIILPLTLALVLNLLLAPLMRTLHRRARVPRPVAALLLILLLVGVVGLIGVAVSVPASGWIARAPDSLPALGRKLAFLKAPMGAVSNGFSRIEAVLAGATGGGHDGGGASAGPSLAGVGGLILAHTRFFLGEVFTLLLVLFFLLAAGDSLLRRFVEILPTFADKKRAVQIATEIESNVSLYLATITVMNGLVGVLNFVQVLLLGMPNPLLWGVVAFVLNYVPILGPLTGIVIFFFVGLFTFNSLLHATLPPLIYLAIHLLEGETVTPMLLARRFTLNPVLVIVSLMFWDWMWGIPGAFLSVPLLAVFKIVCDHIDALTPIGHVLGGAPGRAPTLRRRAAAEGR